MKENEQNIKIKKYKNSYNSNYFKDVISSDKINGLDNSFYYRDIINNWYGDSVNELIKDNNLKNEVDNLTSFLNDLFLLMNNTVELYTLIDRYDFTNKGMINRINIKEFDVLSISELIIDYETVISNSIDKEHYILAIKVKNYCLKKFNECIKILEKNFLLKVFNSPLKMGFKEVRKRIEKSVNLNEFDFLKRNIKNNSNKKDYKITIWFKVGLLFATGEMDKLLKKYNDNPRKVAESLEKPNFEKFILATKNNYKESNTEKNIYYNRDKMLKIIKHCEENNITVTKGFISNLPLE